MEVQELEPTPIRRRWTDELNRTSLMRQSAMDLSGRNNVTSMDDQALQQPFETQDTETFSSEDFEVANIAREQLQKLVDQVQEDPKMSSWQTSKFSMKPTKVKVNEVFKKSLEDGAEITELKTAVDTLEKEWTEKHGPVYTEFKRICRTLDNHRSILKVFPSQNNYASPLVGSVTLLMKAAKSHSEISVLLAKGIAEISEKVARCSNVLVNVRTSGARRKLADIYAQMFGFYSKTLDWYLQSRFGRFVRSFNENFVKEFEDARAEIEDSINELYREASIVNTATVAMLSGQIMHLKAEVHRQRRNYEVKDMLAGQRMEKMVQATWTGVRHIEMIIERAALALPTERIGGMLEVEAAAPPTPTPKPVELDLDAFIIENEGPALLSKGCFWMVEKDVLLKLRPWMAENTESRTLWISSPYEPGNVIPGCRASVMMTVAVAWQAETPIISAFCKRPTPAQLRPGLSIEQVGLISLIYSLIRQLVQFKRTDGIIEIDKDDANALDGTAASWTASLRILKVLLQHTPVVTFCVIDGLNDLELNEGRTWCTQLLDVLKERQKQAGTSFNILLSTAGQSMVLSQSIDVKDRFMATKRAQEVRRSGWRVAPQLGFR